MKINKLYFLSALATVAIATTSFKKADPIKGFAVVELFTSEGCSSCPPADALVAKLQKESTDKPIYILAYHVDYWNHLGWKDAFSDAAYSNRQKDYAKYLKIESIYTPQIVVNGKTEFVGSEEGTLHKSVDAALKKEPMAQLELASNETRPNVAEVHYTVKNNGNKSVLIIAVIQKAAQTKVGGGENNGKSLAHVQIVRTLQTIKLTNAATGAGTITLPAGFSRKVWEIVGLVQSTATGEIMGVAKSTYFHS